MWSVACLQMVEVLFDQGEIFATDFVFELLNLVIHDLELALHLVNLILSLNQVLTIHVPVKIGRAHV